MSLHPGVALRRAIEATDNTQAEVAHGAGLTTKHLNRILRGRALPGIVVTIRLARFLGLDVRELWHAVADYQLEVALNSLDDER